MTPELTLQLELAASQYAQQAYGERTETVDPKKYGIWMDCAKFVVEEIMPQEMGSFAEWTSRNKWKFCTDGLWYSLDEENDNYYTTEELIKRYYESIKG